MMMSRQKLGKTCNLWFCNNKHYGHGYCHKHYQNIRAYGKPISPKNTDLINTLNAINILAKETKHYLAVDLQNNVPVNVVDRCEKCKLDYVATLDWPIVTIACGCDSVELVLESPF